jgi:hypothetical protein
MIFVTHGNKADADREVERLAAKVRAEKGEAGVVEFRRLMKHYADEDAAAFRRRAK